jgi:RNA polymerase sigma factor (sigma-70 family)
MAHDHHRQTLSRRLREIKAAGAEATQAVEVDVDVLMAVERLSVRQRAAVFLTYWEDLSPNEVAERMGVTPGAVKRHLARARKRLAELLS